jgi:hypothetical protein
MAYNDNIVMLEDVRLLFRNFAGNEGPYNMEGDRTFSVLLNEQIAKELERDGFNVKTLKPREEGDPIEYHLPVSLKYRARGGRKMRPPRVVMITSSGRTVLGEDEVELLDFADIIMCDVVIRPFEWSLNGKSGIKAYLQSMFVTINEDPLERKYALRPSDDASA